MPKVRVFEVKVFVTVEADTAEEATGKVQEALEDYNSDHWVDIQEVLVGCGGDDVPEEIV